MYHYDEFALKHIWEMLILHFGDRMLEWPYVHPKRPNVFANRNDKQDEARWNEAFKRLGIFDYGITAEMRIRFHTEINKGQGLNEDAGGYKVRCFKAFIGLHDYPRPIHVLEENL